MTVGTKYIRRINWVLAVVKKCSRSTWEGKAAEVLWWHWNIPGSHRTPSQGLSGAAAGWEGELVHFSAAPPAAHTGIRKDVLPISSTILCSRWLAGDAPVLLGHHAAPSRDQRRSSPWNSGLILPPVPEDWVWYWWCFAALSPQRDPWCFGREEPDRCGARRKR